VTDAEMDHALASYGAGLEAEVSLLHRLEEQAVKQRAATAGGEPPSVIDAIAQTRDRLMAGLLEIESQLRPLRALIAAHRDLAATRPAFPQASSFHRIASALVQGILGADGETLAALRAADAARQQAARALETGGTTLAAYRRVIAPPSTNASLVDERG
jgi:hypothetical protein